MRDLHSLELFVWNCGFRPVSNHINTLSLQNWRDAAILTDQSSVDSSINDIVVWCLLNGFRITAQGESFSSDLRLLSDFDVPFISDIIL